jgi:hypothetical protein
MNAICIAMTFFAMDPTAEDFTKYFDRAAKTKIEIIQFWTVKSSRGQ